MNDNKPRFGAPGDDPLDRAIDRAVRVMMHVDPRAGFRRRVLSRIDAPPRPKTLFPRLVFASAAVAVAVLAVVAIRRDNPAPVVPPPIVVGPEARAAIPSPLPVPKQPASQAASGPADGGRRAPRRSDIVDVPRVGNVFGPPTGRIVGATITDPAVSRFGDPGAVIESSVEDERSLPGVAPLYIAPLDLKPLQIVPLGLPK